jgi:hypothetical protein
MKRILIIILLAFNATQSYSQIFPPTGSINYHPDLDKFTGTWRWSSGNNEVVVKIKKIMYHFKMNGGFDEETLAGCHRYVKNGVIVEDFLPQFDIMTQTIHGSLLFSYSANINPNPLMIRSLVKDNIFNKNEEVRLTLNPNGVVPTLTWELAPIGTTYRPGIDPTPTDDTTLPQDLILIKQP